MKLSYYPGCALGGTARDYAESIAGICRILDIHLEEIPDWNCCGATAAHSTHLQASIELAGRNLQLAANMPYSDMVIPCPMCFNRLKTAVHTLQGNQGDRFQVSLPDDVPKIWDLAEFFAQEAMLRAVADCVKNPLKGLKVVCYYGCMANRPPEITEASDFENPQALDRIVANLGGTVLDWPFKTDCCGASQILSRQDIAFQLVGKLFKMAVQVGAQAVVVSCQMCQANLDIFQKQVAAQTEAQFRFPIYYFSELIGVAMGLDEARTWLSRHITEPFALLKELKLLE